MSNQRIEGEEPETPFHHSYPCTLYYVQSPSVTSHANSTTDSRPSSVLSPSPLDPHHNREISPSTLSRYSSSLGSDHSFLHEKKIAYDLRSDNRRRKNGVIGFQIVGIDEEEGVDDNNDEDSRSSWLWNFISLDPSSSFFCIVVQVAWRFIASVAIALLVFFLVTKPPAPKISFKIAGLQKFILGEGIDNSGVPTNILSCNSSIDMEIENNSQVFGLHLHPPTMEIAFGHLNLARSKGGEIYIPSYDYLTLRLFVGAKNKPMYGAGRIMHDILESRQGLPLTIRVRSRSNYNVVWNLIRPSYRHFGECLLVLDGTYDDRKEIHILNSSCSTTTSHA